MLIQHRTRPTRSADWDRLARAAVVIQHKYLGVAQPWEVIANKGSVTLRNTSAGHEHERIVCFVDINDELSRRAQLKFQDTEPVAVAIELWSFPQLIQQQMRRWLMMRFHDRYIADALVQIRPHYDHLYDVVFLRPGECEEESFDEAEFVLVRNQLSKVSKSKATDTDPAE